MKEQKNSAANLAAAAKRMHLTKEDLELEAELIENEGQWIHMAFLKYDAKTFYEACQLL